MKKWVIIVVVSLVALYGLMVGIKYVCFGRSHEGRVIPPGDFSVTVE